MHSHMVPLPLHCQDVCCQYFLPWHWRGNRVRVGRECRSHSFLYNGNVVPVVFFCILQLLTAIFHGSLILTLKQAPRMHHCQTKNQKIFWGGAWPPPQTLFPLGRGIPPPQALPPLAPRFSRLAFPFFFIYDLNTAWQARRSNERIEGVHVCCWKILYNCLTNENKLL